MISNSNDPIRSEDVHTVVAAEEQQLLEQLQARAPKKRSGITLPLIFLIF